MKVNEYNLAEILPEELFDEIDIKPNDIRMQDRITTSLFERDSFFGASFMDLYVTEDNTFYVLRSQQEPIGDYGSHWIDYWYKCNDNEAVEKILLAEGVF